ncbi:molybdopterin-dependent oxidoreductase [Streptomyces glomeratus]|uniref:Molybdopterin-dependent oxidoreductase n=1 Tax=Streptomyces glomeratus TaxID=284452 RepID=A0ABP6LE56_9ACTN|nr:molybdopterin-dependent oxidoreductase [Streptomyces glomeratus]MCF1508755.1 molybdopterin-dependent oxidoreductase [Streptomyces glomeratus]
MGDDGRPPASRASGGPKPPADEGHARERLRRARATTAALIERAAAGVRAVARRVGQTPPPPGPFRPEFWRSPIRGPWLTSVFGLVLLIGIPLIFITGMLSYAAYNPDLGPLNDQTPDKGVLGFYLFDWPTHPYWLYRLTQGVHVTLGVTLVPVLLAKLWSVIPKLFEWPPVRTVAHGLERLSLLILVGGVIFEFVTGIFNVQLFYVFPGSFYTLHFYGAWVFIAAFVVHAGIRLGRMRRALRSRSLAGELRTDLAHTRPEPPDPDGLVPTAPQAPTMTRRGAVGMVGAGSLLLLVVTAGQSIGGRLRESALLAPHNRVPGSGPNGFQINKTAAAVGVTSAHIGRDWRLHVLGRGPALVFTREQLLVMRHHNAALPIACVEGWSTPDQRWSGLRLTDLAALAGLPNASSVLVESVQPPGPYSSVVLRGNQIHDPRSLLALRVNGADLSIDHGYPARVIVPANPGVNNTKWVHRLTFRT